MSRITNRLGWGVAGALTIALLATLGGVIYAGPLAPPAGPSAPGTGPTQIFSIPAGGLTISVSGSYIVEAQLTGPAGFDGITISAPNVTLDLNGFALVGPGGAGGEIGINATGTSEYTSIRNGTVRDWGGYGLYMRALGSIVADMTFSYVGVNTSDGVYLSGSLTDSVVVNSGTSTRSAVNISDGSIARCKIRSSLGTGLTIANGTASNLTVYVNKVGIDATDATITDSNVSGSSSDGVRATRAIVTGTTVSTNTGSGIYAHFNSRITNNDVFMNFGDGIRVSDSGSDISGNTVTYNNQSATSLAAINVTAFSTGNRIDGNQIEANAATHAIEVDGTNNNITRNTGRDTNSAVVFNIVAGNTFGPSQTQATLANPWANISY